MATMRYVRAAALIAVATLVGARGVATAQAPGEDEPTAWTQMMLEEMATGEMPPPAVQELGPVSSAEVPNYPGVSPIPNLNITPGGSPMDQTETTVAVGLGAFSNNIVVGYNDRAQLNGGFSGYSFSTDGGVTFTQNTSMPQPAGGTLRGDPVLDTSPFVQGRVYYANLCSGGGAPANTIGVCVSISNDGGQTFGNPVQVATPTCNVNVANDCDSFDKEWLTVDSFNGDVYVAYTNFVGGGPPNPPNSVQGQIEAVACDSTLTTCTAPFVVSGAAGTFLQGVSTTYGFNNGRELVLAWYNRTSGNIQSTNCSVSAGGAAINSCAAPVNVVPVGTFAAAPFANAAATLGCGRPALAAAASAFPGFAAGTQAGFRYEPFPVIAADDPAVTPGLFHHLAVTFVNNSYLGGATLNDVWYFRSPDDGGSWPIGPTRVNDDTTATDQFFPHVSAPKALPFNPNGDALGRVNITWYDRRNDDGLPPQTNFLIDVFHSESVDRGVNWNANGQVTDVSFPALPIPGTAAQPFCYWGDYIGHASSALGQHIYAAWGDDRNGEIDTFFATLHNTQDIKVSGNLGMGNVCLGSTATAQLEVFNVGDLNLRVTSVSRVFGSTDITVDPNPTTPLTVSPDAHVDFTVRCTPTTYGSKTATIRITSDDPDQPTIDVPATCSAPPGDIKVTGSTTFGDVCAEDLAEKTVNVCNVGEACSLNFTAAFIDCTDFTIVNNPLFPAAISHDFCVPLTIRFTPQSAGPKTCNLNVVSDDPDTPIVTLPLTGNTPSPSIDVPPDLPFPPTVVQETGVCKTPEAFPVSNTGQCNLHITDFAITQNPAAYSLDGLPSFPIILEPGHEAGEGDLSVVFGPHTPLDRDVEGEVSVTYVSEPILNQKTTVTRALCGESVNTGARVLVTENGSPVASVEKIQLQRITGNRRKKRILQSIGVVRNVPLTTVNPAAPCPSFQYHYEWSTVDNPIQLLTGSYQVTATIVSAATGRRETQTVGFSLDTCDFNANVTIEF